MTAATISARGRRAETRRRTRGVELTGAVVLLGSALALGLNADAVIELEARMTAFVMGLFTLGGTNSYHHLVYIGIGTEQVHGFLITPLCTSLVLVTPVLVLAGMLLIVPRYRLSWVLRGLAVALPLALWANLTRFVLVGVALQLWGRSGFEVMHHYVGSVLVLLCAAAALIVLLLIATTGRLSLPGWLLPSHGRHA